MEQKKAAAPAAEGISGKLQWHPAFSSALQIELADDMDALTFHTEYPLTRKPLVMDMLVIKKNAEYRCANEIAAFFRGHNIIEYKNPRQSCRISDWHKTLAYAAIFQSNTQKETEIAPGDITITIVCGKLPRKLMNYFRNTYGVRFRICGSGIYRADKNIPFPVQFIINPKLDSEKFKWLSRLRCNLRADSDVEVLADEYKGKENNPLYETAMDVIMRANQSVYKEAKDMCSALRELFAEELKEKETEGLREGLREGLSALINTLKEFCADSDAIYARVTQNPVYADLSRAEFEEYL